MEIKFQNEALVTFIDKNIKYHDDMFGENVFILLNNKPEFIHSYDYREFNGVPIKIMAEVLQKYYYKVFDADMEYYKWRKEYFNKS